MKLTKWLTVQWHEFKGIILFLVLMTVFRSALADWNLVPSGSMQPTIVEGDRILVNKLAYDLRLPFSHISLLRLGDPARGDIIVFDSGVSNIRLVKRVIGIPGDVIQMRDNRLEINGEPLRYQTFNLSKSFEDRMEDLLGTKHAIRIAQGASLASSFPRLSIPHGFYLVLGDNRDNSADSRFIGLVPRGEIVGRTRSVVMSLDRDNHYLPRMDRFLRTL